MTSYVPVQGILKGKSPDRDREIEAWQNMIRAQQQPGSLASYLMSILGNVRTGRDPGRADTSHSSSNLKLVKEQSDRLGVIPGYGIVMDILGTAHLLPRAGGAGRQRVQGAHRKPSERLHRSRRRVSACFQCCRHPMA